MIIYPFVFVEWIFAICRLSPVLRGAYSATKETEPEPTKNSKSVLFVRGSRVYAWHSKITFFGALFLSSRTSTAEDSSLALALTQNSDLEITFQFKSVLTPYENMEGFGMLVPKVGALLLCLSCSISSSRLPNFVLINLDDVRISVLQWDVRYDSEMERWRERTKMH